MIGKKKLPIGIDIFEKLDREEFYYVDKTGMIEDLLQNRSEVNRFTRPRCFGKSLNMSMLKAFFEIGGDPGLFEGLKISTNKELCEKALHQIEDRDYAAKLKDDGMRNIIKYGIACYKKNCKVVLG